MSRLRVRARSDTRTQAVGMSVICAGFSTFGMAHTTLCITMDRDTTRIFGDLGLLLEYFRAFASRCFILCVYLGYSVLCVRYISLITVIFAQSSCCRGRHRPRLPALSLEYECVWCVSHVLLQNSCPIMHARLLRLISVRFASVCCQWRCFQVRV